MRKDLAQKVLDMAASRADGAEVVLDAGESSAAHFENNKLKSIETKGILGIGVRVIHKGRIGFSCTTDLSDSQRVVRNALDSAAFGQEAKFQFPGPAKASDPKTSDPAVPAFPLHDGIAACREAIDRLLSYDAKLDCAAGFGKYQGERHVLNTSGLAIEHRGTQFDAGAYALRVAEDGTLTHADDGEDSRRVALNMDKYVKEIIEQLDLSKKSVRVPPGRMPVIFVPESLRLLIATFSTNVNGKALQKGSSLLKGRLGEQVLDARVSLWDDALVDYAVGSSACDGEGMPCRRQPIFENGIFRNFTFDLQTAGMTGNTSTANASRSFASQPSPGLHNLRLTPGTVPYAEMLSGMKRGLLVYRVLGGGQSNVLAGEFSVNVEMGFLVENGGIVGRVKDAMLAGNAFDAFRSIEAIGRETEWRGSSEFPHVCFKDLAVSSAQQQGE
jgi:PmbA protein